MRTSIRSRSRRFLGAAGFMIIALGASTGIVTSATSWASGVSVNSDAQMMANDASSYPLQFDAAVQTSIMELNSADPAATSVSATFYASYVSSTKDYGTALLSAANLYTESYATDPAGAKNTYIDNFSNARATYFNKLEAARNALVSELSGTNEPAKNMFVNEYNSARDTYNNQLESIKNEVSSL